MKGSDYIEIHDLMEYFVANLPGGEYRLTNVIFLRVDKTKMSSHVFRADRESIGAVLVDYMAQMTPRMTRDMPFNNVSACSFAASQSFSDSFMFNDKTTLAFFDPSEIDVDSYEFQLSTTQSDAEFFILANHIYSQKGKNNFMYMNNIRDVDYTMKALEEMRNVKREFEEHMDPDSFRDVYVSKWKRKF